MNRVLLHAVAAVLAPMVICACARPSVKLSDPPGSMEHVPHSTSFPYVPVDGSLSMVKETGKEEALLRQGELETKGGIPPGFKGKVLNLSDCMRIALEVSPETKATWQAVRSAAARVGEEKSACLPSADFSAAAARQKQVSSQSLQSGQPRVQ